jgi:PAS domain S-box-containing protein
MDNPAEVHFPFASENLLGHLSDAVIATDHTLQIIYWNQAAERLYGWQAEEAFGQTIDDLLKTVWISEHQAQAQATLLAEGLWHGELEQQTKTGQALWVSASVSIVKDGQGQIVGGVTVNRDISERKQTEHSLYQTAAYLRSLVETQTAYVIRTDLNGNYTYANQTFFKQFGWMYPTMEALVGTPSLATILPEDHAKTAQTVLDCLQDLPNPKRVILRKPTQEGGYTWTFWEFSLVIDETDLPYEFQCVGLDITELMEARQRLDVQNAALNATITAVVITDQNAVIQWVNPAFSQLTGYSAEEAIGQRMSILSSGVHDQTFYQDLWETVQAGQVWQSQFINKRKDGSLYTEEQIITPVRDENKVIRYFIATKQDVTEREQAAELRLEQERLSANLRKEREHNALMQKIITALSHDLRTPLSIIMNAKELLVRHRDQKDSVWQQEKLEAIGRHIQFVMEILEDTVALARNNGDQAKFHPTSVNLVTFCQVTLDEIQHTSGIKHQLQFTTDQQISSVKIDETLVGRILLNLLSNAVKFSPPGSQITLSLTRSDEWMRLQVSDQGIGIAPDVLAHIFEPFYRAEAARSISGTGLGLSIVKDCVERHQGRIQVQSQPDQGTTFTIELPLML